MRLYIFLFIVIFSQACKSSYSIPSDLPNSQIAQDIRTLSDDKMKGRETGKEGEKMAAEYIIKQFEKLGLQPAGNDVRTKKGWYQKFTGYDSSHPHGDMAADKVPVNGRNVIGLIDNGAAQTVVIGGHYDHLGMGGFGSLYTGGAEIHNGADDNASGIAVMLYLADVLRKDAYKENNYLFIAFSGEEKGLWGSNYWTKNPTYPLEKISYMINFDMVGRLEDKKLAINGTGTSPRWTVLDDVNKKFELVKSESGIGPSDHSSFYLVDIPSIHFFTGQHEDYHKPSDDFEKVNIAGCYEIGNYVLQVVDKLQGEKLVFTKTKDESVETPSFKVTLGVMPDYMYNGEGMRIDGVQEGRTADAAGMKNGDIVVKMGDLDIVDMMSYMKALGKFEKGTTTTVIVLRDGERVEKEVTFQ